MPAWPTRGAVSTHLGLLVVLVLDAIDLLQQVANPVHLQGRAASGHPRHQGLLCTPQPDTPSQGPGSVPGGRRGRLLCPTAHAQGAGTAGDGRAKCPEEAWTRLGQVPPGPEGVKPSSTGPGDRTFCSPYQAQPHRRTTPDPPVNPLPPTTLTRVRPRADYVSKWSELLHCPALTDHKDPPESHGVPVSSPETHA